jgi:hypothetical protein
MQVSDITGSFHFAADVCTRMEQGSQMHAAR